MAEGPEDPALQRPAAAGRGGAALGGSLYENEVDVHLNPKICLRWMGYGQQKEVQTLGQNEKRYLAGALDLRTGQLTWVEGAKKTCELFVDLLVKR